MAKFSVGVMVDSFKVPLFEGLDKAKQVGAQGIQLYVVEGENKYDTFDDAKVAAVNAALAERGLVISAVCGDFGGHGFERADENEDTCQQSCCGPCRQIKYQGRDYSYRLRFRQ